MAACSGLAEVALSVVALAPEALRDRGGLDVLRRVEARGRGVVDEVVELAVRHEQVLEAREHVDGGPALLDALDDRCQAGLLGRDQRCLELLERRRLLEAKGLEVVLVDEEAHVRRGRRQGPETAGPVGLAIVGEALLSEHGLAELVVPAVLLGVVVERQEQAVRHQRPEEGVAAVRREDVRRIRPGELQPRGGEDVGEGLADADDLDVRVAPP